MSDIKKATFSEKVDKLDKDVKKVEVEVDNVVNNVDQFVAKVNSGHMKNLDDAKDEINKLESDLKEVKEKNDLLRKDVNQQWGELFSKIGNFFKRN